MSYPGSEPGEQPQSPPAFTYPEGDGGYPPQPTAAPQMYPVPQAPAAYPPAPAYPTQPAQPAPSAYPPAPAYPAQPAQPAYPTQPAPSAYPAQPAYSPGAAQVPGYQVDPASAGYAGEYNYGPSGPALAQPPTATLPQVSGPPMSGPPTDFYPSVPMGGPAPFSGPPMSGPPAKRGPAVAILAVLTAVFLLVGGVMAALYLTANKDLTASKKTASEQQARAAELDKQLAVAKSDAEKSKAANEQNLKGSQSQVDDLKQRISTIKQCIVLVGEAQDATTAGDKTTAAAKLAEAKPICQKADQYLAVSN